ncbi:YHYH protein [Yoonia sp. MH D7]
MRYSPLCSAITYGLLCVANVGGAHEADLTLETATELLSTANIVVAPQIVDCTLSEGAETQCIQFTVKPEPTNYAAGPWCARNISDGADAGGIWLKDGAVHEADGAFFTMLADLYNDEEWQVYDEATGAINVTPSAEACAAAARPDVDPQYNNFCVQCEPDYVASDLTVTYTIPLTPVAASQPSQINFGGAGVATNGIKFDGPAPLDAILDAHTIAPFDDCGGHVNLNVGYHFHVAGDCLETTEAALDAPIIGIAMDGYLITENALGLYDLDQCNGHVGDTGPYHYHAGAAGSNQILGCLTAQTGCASTQEGTVCDASQQQRPPRR